MPTLPQGRLLVLSFSLALSCVALGVSINLLHDPKAMVLPSTNNADMTTNWPPPTHNSPRDRRTPSLDSNSFRVVEILGAVSSALNVLVVAVLLVASSMKRKTIVSAVAIEAPCIYLVSFMWLVTGAYAEQRVELGPGYYPFEDAPECARYKVLEGISFINWVQLMLYANTLMTVATICHVRRHRVWLLPVTELPTFAAPVLKFGSSPDRAFDSPFATKVQESEVPILVHSSQSVDSHTSHHFRSRLPFLPHPLAPPGVPSNVSSQPPPSDSVTSLAPSLTQADATDLQNATSQPPSSTGYRIVPTGEPPTYSGPGSNHEHVSL